MPSVFDVAAYIIEKLGPVSHMKLQKLLYYAQAWSTVWDEEALFPERIEAWRGGPAVPVLFEKFEDVYKITSEEVKRHGGDASKLSPEQKDTIDKMLEFYGQRDLQYLGDLARAEEPWRKARIGLPANERGNREIALASMAMYYGSL